MTGIAIGDQHTIPGRNRSTAHSQVMLLRPAESRDLPSDQEFGADDGTRTRDPHLGKVSWMIPASSTVVYFRRPACSGRGSSSYAARSISTFASSFVISPRLMRRAGSTTQVRTRRGDPKELVLRQAKFASSAACLRAGDQGR
jgi:hypothetical protein